jgi:putative ABC transport system permease protein
MLKSYFIIAWRNLWRNKVYSFINLFGLSIGLASCLLLFLYTRDEVSYDQFHDLKDRIFRITVTHTSDRETRKIGSTNMVVGPAFKQEIPGIKTFVRMQGNTGVVRLGNAVFKEETLFADEDFFTVFSFPLVAGEATQVLSALNSVVLTQETAQKYFGNTPALGKTVELEIGTQFVPFIVTGIAQNPPRNSSIQFKMVFPFKYTETKFPDQDWLGFYMNTFIVLHPQVDYKRLESQLDRVFRSRAQEQLRKIAFRDHIHFGLQPLPDIHLDTEFADIRNGLQDGSDPIYSYILTGISGLLLIIACINFINITLAHSLKRGKEIGIRKVMGGQRQQLIKQFLGESFFLCLLAFVLAILMAHLILPFFNAITHKHLSFSYLWDYKTGTACLLLFCITACAAGFYPALILSGFSPAQTLYHRHKLTDKHYLTKGLIVFQFALTTFLMIVMVAVYAQFNFLTHKKLGYNDENLVVVHLGRGVAPELVHLFKRELHQVPAIQAAAIKSPGQNYTSAEMNGRSIEFAIGWIDENYLPVLQLPVVKGRNFSPAFSTDGSHGLLINETFARAAGWAEPIGKKIFNVNGNQRQMTVIGVVKDHHFASLKEKIGPQLFQLYQSGPGDILVKLQPDRLAYALNALEMTFHQLLPFRPFAYDFLRSLNEQNYRREAQWKQIIFAGAVVTLLVSCMGLFGLVALSMGQRTKEIGIRKAYGAAVSDILLLLSKDFVKLIGLAFLIGVPLGYYAIHQWLQDYAYRIPVDGWLLALPCLGILLVALLTILMRTGNAALANPVKSLRHE